MARDLRRRIDSGLLRWQARLDSPWADRAIPWGVAAVLFTALALSSSARSRSLEVPPDLAGDLQALWLVREGGDLGSSLAGGADVLALHLSLLTVPLGYVAGVVPPTGLLLTLQAAALAATVVPLWWLARQTATLRVGAACALVLAYTVNPAVHALNLSGFHVEVVALPALVAAAWAGLSGRHVVLAVCVGVCLAARADLGIAVGGLGLVLALNGRRRVGAATAAVGVGWAVLATFVVQPWLDASNPHVRPLQQWGDTPVGVVGGLLSDPGGAFAQVLDERNTALVVLLLGPLLFLPVLVPRFLVGVVPTAVVALVADGPDDLSGTGRVVPLVAFCFVASTFALHRLGRTGVERVTVDRRLLIALSLAAVMFFVDSGSTSPYRHPWEWGSTGPAERARHEVADRLGEEVAVRAEPGTLLLVAERRHARLFDPTGGPDAAAAVAGVDALVVADDSLGGWTELERASFASALASFGFGPTYDEAGITLYERGAATGTSGPSPDAGPEAERSGDGTAPPVGDPGDPFEGLTVPTPTSTTAPPAPASTTAP